MQYSVINSTWINFSFTRARISRRWNIARLVLLQKCRVAYKVGVVIVCSENRLNKWPYFMMTSSNGNNVRVVGLCEENSPVTGEFPPQRPVTWSFDIFFDLRLNKRLSKQSRPWWFETPSCSLWRHCNVCCNWYIMFHELCGWLWCVLFCCGCMINSQWV